MARIVVLGAGFAGLWAAIGAARKREEIGASERDIEIHLVDRNPYHNIRVRNYEADLAEVALPLPQLLDPIGVSHRLGEIEAIDPARREISLVTSAGEETLSYDRLVLALGSEVMRPDIPGLAAHGFDVDSYAAALRLEDHLVSLGRSAPSVGRSTVVVVGAGFTGIEVAAEMPARLAHAGITGSRRIILVDSNPSVGASIGAHARPVIETALASLDVEMRLGVRVASVEAAGVHLSSGEFIPAQTVIWCAGMRASPLAASFPGGRDRLGRLLVDPFMRVADVPGVFAAGDVASSVIDGLHPTVMSCQFARPMGRFAGHNVVADLVGLPMLPLRIDWYVTVLDLGGWGALYTEGWNREVRATGAAAKATKETINRKRIYPPLTGRKDELFAAAAPTVQAPPPTYGGR
ncbi:MULTISPECIES: NAD(P)/FAD-dependent oxidoreductase [Bradyrhizobium]|uniref:NAD(P)/FAD-dependent oxidoreductase n=1 Tax=Bradyrhizobium TaxID=374 RepID=UPI00155EE776|nr:MULTISPECIES: NAD(P)/FAD-dependent oxidoreductase [Bradyrhizobium]MDD1523546.1 proton-conducting membrane transporter [Bradyrhizobium sp. WBAH30]MDD1547631.1 proton-conducting membrane transporter [Bradyrhizobium sp. WBAH41]MDD1561266.1 proton-conducting membrane transporter [Bradyrhizobium sp. WBAH23]MDD1567091.1 proton-conducting membrane transporter [Bradyrhizobium sp. WBAH33]MDD1594704.1 proton-conducting membrane transporter [Bradyrhizobium sp. WBAH42]